LIHKAGAGRPVEEGAAGKDARALNDVLDQGVCNDVVKGVDTPPAHLALDEVAVSALDELHCLVTRLRVELFAIGSTRVSGNRFGAHVILYHADHALHLLDLLQDVRAAKLRAQILVSHRLVCNLGLHSLDSRHGEETED
jgi:hypothetical protein